MDPKPNSKPLDLTLWWRSQGLHPVLFNRTAFGCADRSVSLHGWVNEAIPFICLLSLLGCADRSVLSRYARRMSVRVDVWLWSVRVFKTRSDSTLHCSTQKVRVNDKVAKPSRRVIAGDRVVAKTRNGVRILEVVATPKKRQGAAVAAEAYVDHSPPPEPRQPRPTAQAVREPGSGRPTKRDRRQIDRFRGRE